MQSVARAPIDALRPRRLRRRNPLRFANRLPGGRLFDVFEDRPLGGRVRAVRRLVTVLLWTLLCMPVQALLLALPGDARARFPMLFHRVLCWLLGVKLQVIGTPCADRPVLFVANHSSWLDIPVLGAVLPAAFVAKAEVGTWPLIRTVARLGRTVFVSRNRGTTGKEAEAMRGRMAGGGSLVLFPEGTSNDGTRVLPFRSAFFAVADGARQVQPVSVVYDRLGGLPACRRDRPLFAWYGDMEMGSHVWRLARRSGARVTVVLHEPFPPGLLPNRKVLAAEAERIVALGAERLRQNRPVAPMAPRPGARLPVSG
ncbi:lysophospholipid acyltransferase family protein [Paracraurococcus ruber]|uniref:1-acyl-sn-glycerol-3-phosphate acyltransferase n=1 Tax=Paracraurococcus ruber TaxID=77675 RepID=A0ABS1D3Q2_9PROT|nr:lysophospholipid acyltransferase family protein [Paracraurococcus ruber]MBK1661075.1 1-acyl-sn-glycerol-3-phosphate acyltransferase [Paracraurococcus ruber]TDG28263.1 1-acyl-sn-glycerol-3-phosphate acyltransferase [Paracraurococcus ruber]